MSRRRLAVLALVGALWCSGRARAASPEQTRRFAIVIGSNLGQAHEPTLRYARRDAERVAQTLRELGGVAQRDLALLLDPEVATVRRAFEDVAARTSQETRPAVLIVYYSGHADATALHLGGAGVLPWDELRTRIEGSGAQLRVALIDSCQSGSMTTDKGITLGPQIVAAQTDSKGTAILASSSSSESSQEAQSLGGSFFTHFLVSGLRGAADMDGDGRVTLSEAYAYTAKNTQQATGAWARAVQHPSYQFDISGQGEIVLADLQEASAQLALDAPLDGHVLISEAGSPLVLVESDKRAGQLLRIALPSGRYRVHLRRPNAIYVADVNLPWGGRAQLAERNFARRTYQEVAQKGALLEIHRHRVRVGVGLGEVLGTFAPWGRIGYSYKAGHLEYGVRLIGTALTVHGRDADARTEMVGGGASMALVVPLRIGEMKLGINFDLQYWHQRITDVGQRRSIVPSFGGVAVWRVPLWRRLFAEIGYEATVNLLLAGRKTSLDLGQTGELGVGYLF